MKTIKKIFLFCMLLFIISSCNATSDDTDSNSYNVDDITTHNDVPTDKNINEKLKYVFIDEDPTYPDIKSEQDIYEDDENNRENKKNNGNSEITQKDNIIENNDNARTVFIDANKGNDNNNGDAENPYKTLLKAVDCVGNNSVINIKNGKYILNQTILINKTLTINGENTEQTVIDCNQIMALNITTTKLTINNLTFINGFNKAINKTDTFETNPGVIVGRSDVILLINNCIFVNNTGKMGTAVFSTGKMSEINITNTIFDNNIATDRAGALHISGEKSISYIHNCTFINNQVTSKEVLGSRGNGGAIYLGGLSNLTLSDCNFMNQTAINGSCIYTGNNACIKILNSNFINNQAINNNKQSNYISRGGALTFGSGSGTIKNSTFINNTASYGGALSINSGNVTDIEDCTFTNNFASIHAGAIHSFGKTTIKNSNFTNNSAVRRAGAIISAGTFDEMQIENCQFINNHLNETYNKNQNYSLGGAIGVHGQSANLTIKNTKFTNNTAAYGGAIYCANDIDSTQLVNNTFNNNSAISGGAIMISSTCARLRVTDDLYYNNIAKKEGGAISFNDNGISSFIDNTIFKNNSATNGGAISIPEYTHLSCTNLTFTENTAKDKGGAIYINESTFLKLHKSKLSLNKATTGSAIYFNNLNSTNTAKNNVELRSNSIYNNFENYSIYSTTKNSVNAKYNWWGSNHGNTTTNDNVDASSPIILLFTLREKKDNNINFEINIAMCNESNSNFAGICDSVIYLPIQEVTLTTHYDKEIKIQTLELYKKLNVTIPDKATKVTLQLDEQTLTYEPGDLRESYIRLTATKINDTQTEIKAEVIDGLNNEIKAGNYVFKINGVTQTNKTNLNNTTTNPTFYVNNTSNTVKTYVISFVYSGAEKSNYAPCRQNITIIIEGKNNANTKQQENLWEYEEDTYIKIEN